MKPETIKWLLDSGMTSDELLSAMQQHESAKRTMESIGRDRGVRRICRHALPSGRQIPE